MIAHIIFLNDAAKGVVLDDEEKANKEKIRLKEEYTQKNTYVTTDLEEFEHINYWHIKSVSVLE